MLWVYLLILGLIWGTSFIGITKAVAGMPPANVAFGRITVAAVVLGALALWRGGFNLSWRAWLFAGAAALLSNALPFVLLAYGQQSVASVVAGVFMAALPLMVLPLSHFLIPGERLTPGKLLGFGIGFLGVLWLLSPALLAVHQPEQSTLGLLAVFGATVCYAFGSITMKRAPKSDPIAFAAGAMLLAALMLTPFIHLEWPSRTDSLVAVAYLGLFPTGLGLVIMLRVLAEAGPPFLSLVNYQVPVWAMLFGALVLNEQVAPQLGGALVLIVLGVAVSQWRGRGAA